MKPLGIYSLGSIGDARSSFDYDGGEYKDENYHSRNLMFNKFTDTDLQVGFNVDSQVCTHTFLNLVYFICMNL